MKQLLIRAAISGCQSSVTFTRSNLTLSELEKSIGQSLEQGYVRRPAVSVKISGVSSDLCTGHGSDARPLSLSARAVGACSHSARGRHRRVRSKAAWLGDLFQTDERVRLLEISRVALLAKQARLIAQQNGDDRIDFPDMSALVVDPARITQIRDGEERAFAAERQAEQQETEALRKQFPRLEAEIASLKQQGDLEQRQRDLNQQLIADYEQLAKSGLARKPTYIEVKREEARIDGNIGASEIGIAEGGTRDRRLAIQDRRTA